MLKSHISCTFIGSGGTMFRYGQTSADDAVALKLPWSHLCLTLL